MYFSTGIRTTMENLVSTNQLGVPQNQVKTGCRSRYYIYEAVWADKSSKHNPKQCWAKTRSSKQRKDTEQTREVITKDTAKQ